MATFHKDMVLGMQPCGSTALHQLLQRIQWKLLSCEAEGKRIPTLTSARGYWVVSF